MKPFFSKKLRLQLLNRVLFIVTLAIFVLYLERRVEWVEIKSMSVNSMWLVSAFLMSIVCLIIYASLWYLLTRYLVFEANYLESISIWLFSNFGKYFPFKIVGLGYRAVVYRERKRSTVPQVIHACYMETLLAVLGGVLVSLFFVSVTFRGPAVFEKKVFMLIIAAFIVGGLITPRLQLLLFKVINSLARSRGAVDLPISWPRALFLIVLYSGSWLVAGVGLFFLICAFECAFPLRELGYISMLYSFAGVAGMISFFAPAGLGVRDGILLFGLSSVLPGTMAGIIVVVARLLSTVVEIIGIVLGFVYLEKSKAV